MTEVAVARSVKATFRLAFVAGLGTLLGLVVLLVLIGDGIDAPFAVVAGSVLGILAAGAWLAAGWGGRDAVLGFLAGFLGTVASALLLAFAWALFYYRRSGLFT